MDRRQIVSKIFNFKLTKLTSHTCNFYMKRIPD